MPIPAIIAVIGKLLGAANAAKSLSENGNNQNVNKSTFNTNRKVSDYTGGIDKYKTIGKSDDQFYNKASSDYANLDKLAKERAAANAAQKAGQSANNGGGFMGKMQGVGDKVNTIGSLIGGLKSLSNNDQPLNNYVMNSTFRRNR